MDDVDSRPPSRKNCFGILPVDEFIDGNVESESVVQVDAEAAPTVSCAGHISPIVSVQRPSKRLKSSNDFLEGDKIEEEGFTVVHSKATRLAKNKAIGGSNDLLSERSFNKQYIEPQCFEVCVTSYQMLPKKIDLANLLISEKIDSFKNIQFKNPYKAHILFENKKDADGLLRNNSLSSAGIRCYLTSEVATTNGVVRNLEMEITEEQMMEAFECEFEIVAAKRLKRVSERGDWVLSETVRFAFKGQLLPAYIYGYGCRFKVEPFAFPVTQCSACWKFGHSTRSCPTKQAVCPKCGENHANCEVTKFRCVNCKGEHMAFDKSCPVFLEEREIREIMSKDNITYKNAVAKYTEKKRNESRMELVFEFGGQPMTYELTRPDFSYNQSVDAKLTHREVPNQEPQERSDSTRIEESDNDPKEDSCEENVQSKNPNKKKRKSRGRKIKKKKSDLEMTEKETEEEQHDQGYLSRILSRTKKIFGSKESLQGKVRMVLQFVLEEVMSLIVKTISNLRGSN